MEKRIIVRSHPWFTNAEVEFAISDENVQFSIIKKLAILEFNLEEDSMYTFGLFELQPHCLPIIPLKLYMDWDTATEKEYLNLGLLKLCFSRKTEEKLMISNHLAIEKFYHEARNSYEVGTMVGSPKDVAEAANERVSKYTLKRKKLRQHVPKLVQHVFVPPEEDKYLKLKRKGVTEYTIEDYFMFASGMKQPETCHHSRYMETMHCLNRFYWSYFHKVVGCTLCGDFAKVMAPYMNLNAKFEVVVTLNRTCLSILGVTTANQFLHLADFPWIGIHSVKMNPAEKTFSFHVLYEGKKKHYANLVTISIRTDYFEYLYTMTLYLLQMCVNVLLLVDLKTNHILTEEEFRFIESLRPSSIDHDNFLCMILPPDFLQYLGEKIPAKFELNLPLEISALPEAEDVVPPEVMYINTDFRAVAFRLKQVHVTPEQIKAEKEPGYLKVICGKNTCTFPFYSSDTVAKFSSCFKISPSPNSFSRVVTVHTFLGTFRIPVYRYTMMVKEFLQITCKHLRLTLTAHFVFVLYSYEKHGHLHSSTRIYLEISLPNNVSQFVLRRFALYKELETDSLSKDSIALNMLYYEAKHMFENDLVLPRIEDSKVMAELKQISGIGDKKLSSNLDIKMKIQFLLKISQASTYWWLNYHRVENVEFPNITELFDKLHPPEVNFTTMTLAETHVCFLDAAQNIYGSIQTRKIRAVLLHKSHNLTFEVLKVVRSAEGEFETIIVPLLCISKVSYDYIFFVMNFVLTLFNYKGNRSALPPLNVFVHQCFGPSFENEEIHTLCINFFTSAA